MLIKKEYKMIPIDKLESMADYQRSLDMNFIEEKSKDGIFDKDAVECPKISVRNDGTKKMGDGQHTVGIVKRRGWKSIRCELRYGLTIKEENDWFAQENTKRRPQNNKRILTAQINGTYEKNKEEQDFYNCLKSLGFKLNIYGEESGNEFKIGCSASLLNLYTTLQDYEIKPCRRNSDIKASIMLFDFIVVSMFCTKVAKNTCSRICLLRINRNSWALSPRYFAKSFS